VERDEQSYRLFTRFQCLRSAISVLPLVGMTSNQCGITSSRFIAKQGDLQIVSLVEKTFPSAFLELMTAGKHILRRLWTSLTDYSKVPKIAGRYKLVMELPCEGFPILRIFRCGRCMLLLFLPLLHHYALLFLPIINDIHVRMHGYNAGMS